MQTDTTGAIDRAGALVSAACFVHCLVTPLLFSLSAVYAHFLPSEEHVHRLLAVVVSVLGGVALTLGYRRHKQKSILLLFAAGLMLICAGAYFGDRLPSHWLEIAITLAGSCCMITAHRRNHTFCRQCAACEASA